MANQWFRLYAEFITDPKVQIMTEAMQRRLIGVFCLRCSNVLETLHETDIAFALRISDDELAQTKQLFMAKGFIDESWNVLNWNSRQYVSDSSTERVRQYRKRCETFLKQDETVSVTAPDTDTEQKQNRNRTEKTIPPLDAACQKAAEQIHVSHPRERRDLGVQAIAKRLKEICSKNSISPEQIADNHESWCQSDQWRQNGGKYAKGLENWLAPTKSRWADPAPTVRDETELRLDQIARELEQERESKRKNVNLQ
jgi:hypothetical protein